MKRAEPKGAFEHRAIKEVIIKSIFTASKGMDCLADAFEDGETDIFNPVPLETIALATTAVMFCFANLLTFLIFYLLARSFVLFRNGCMGYTHQCALKVRSTSTFINGVSSTWGQ